MRKSLEAAALVFLCLTWGWTAQALFGANPLPAQIPVHFDLAGRPDRWGTPQTLWLIPLMTAVIYSLMTLVARYPSALAHYRHAARWSGLRRRRSRPTGAI